MTVTQPSVYYPRMGAKLGVVLDGLDGADRGLELKVIPKSARVQRNGYAIPDTFSIEVDGRTLPFDPEQFRGAQVEIYMFSARHARSDESWNQDRYRRIAGVVDDTGLEMGADGRTLSLEGVDYTGIFAEAEWDPRTKIESGRTLDVTVQRMLDTVQAKRPGFQMQVEWRGRKSPPVIGAGRRARHRRPRPVRPGSSVWDVIHDTCLREGYIVYVEGLSVVIRDTVTNDDSNAQMPAVAYGRNLRQFRVSRGFGSDIVPQVIAEGRLPSGTYAREKWPAQPRKARRIAAIAVDPERAMTINYRQVPSRKELRRRARLAFERKARGESKYRFATPHMQDLRGNDLLDIQAGDAIQIRWDAFNSESLRELPDEKRVQHLRELGYPASVAAVVSANLNKLRQLGQPYYVSTAELACDNQSGFEFSVEALNFAFEAREES